MSLVSLPGITLTEEQKAILETCQPPLQHGKGQLVRVTAAAGTGKTTSLLALALQAAHLGHNHITYLTFTKAAALDGTRRLSAALANAGLLGKVIIDAKTLHSCALKELVKYESTKNPDVITSNKIWSEKKVKNWISHTLNDEIEEFMGPCIGRIESWQNLSVGQRAAIFRRSRDRVEFFIFKTLRQFCTRSISFKQFEDIDCFDRNYYPAKKFHTTAKSAEKLGFETRVYANKTRWYADQACKLCRIIEKEDVRTFDFVMKRAQLLALEIPGTCLLIDESQDMDGCQVNWVAEKQVEFAKQVYVVGDAAQAIYGFRGAKSKYLMDLPIDKELMLTESWRFGEAIAQIANLVLFAKENSDQTEKSQGAPRDGMKWKNWIPYRVKSGRAKAAHVTDASLISSWQDYRAESKQITLIARQNKTLFQATLQIFGFTPSDDSDSTTKSPIDGACIVDRVKKEAIVEEEDDFDYIDDCNSDAEASCLQAGQGNRTEPGTLLAGLFPKIHINGYGETSGRKTWLSLFKLIGTVYDLFALLEEAEEYPDSAGSIAMRLPPALFPEFAGREVSWVSFCEDVREGEMNKYTIPISVVQLYKKDTMAAVEKFKREVIDKNYSREDADILLTTCHAAKGMEWEYVEVLDDFIDLANYQCDHRDQNRRFQPAIKRQKGSPWKFGFAAWGDDLNLAYVAVTRAQHMLSISPFLLKCIRDFDNILQWKAAGKSAAAELPFIQGLAHRESQMTPQSLDDIHSSLVEKFRKEVGVEDGCPLIEYLLCRGDQGGGGVNVKSDSGKIPAPVTPVAVHPESEGKPTTPLSARRSLEEDLHNA